MKGKEADVFVGKIFRVTVEQVGKLRFERVYQRNGVGIFPIPKAGYIRFIQTSDPDGGNQRIAPVCGYIAECDRSPLACAKRELREELALGGKEWQLLATVKGGGGFIKSQYFFAVRGLRNVRRVRGDSEERIYGFVDLPYEEVERRMWNDEFPADVSFALLKLIRKA